VEVEGLRESEKKKGSCAAGFQQLLALALVG